MSVLNSSAFPVESPRGFNWVNDIMIQAAEKTVIIPKSKLTPPDLTIDDWRKISNGVGLVERHLLSESFYEHLKGVAMCSAVFGLITSLVAEIIHWSALTALSFSGPVSPRTAIKAYRIKNLSNAFLIISSVLFWGLISESHFRMVRSALNIQAEEINRLCQSKIDECLK